MEASRHRVGTNDEMKWQTIFSPEWIFRFCAIALLVANLYLNNHFIGKEEYAADKHEWTKSMTKLGDAVSDLKFALAQNVEQRAIINDHESRIRALEKWSHPSHP